MYKLKLQQKSRKLCVHCKFLPTAVDEEPCNSCAGSGWEMSRFVSSSGRSAMDIRARTESDGGFEVINPDGEVQSYSIGELVESKIKKAS